jgi:ribosomal protein L11 methylase PrmA
VLCVLSIAVLRVKFAGWKSGVLGKAAASMDYAIYRLVINAGLEAALTEAFHTANFTAYVISTRSDGRLDLELYGMHGVFPDAVLTTLATLGLASDDRRCMSERELLANVLDGEPCELCAGVWIDPQGLMSAKDGQLVLHIPPSPAFGDGHHPSTKMCAALLMGMDVRGQRVLDLGCGTGVLGLIAHQRGAASVIFSDIDEGSVRTTRATCASNGYPNAVVIPSDLLTEIPPAPVDILVANLYADPLMALAGDPRLPLILPHGTLIASGIAQLKRPLVEAAFAAVGFTTQEVHSDAWWNALMLVR